MNTKPSLTKSEIDEVSACIDCIYDYTLEAFEAAAGNDVARRHLANLLEQIDQARDLLHVAPADNVVHLPMKGA
ncbi:hypothetical protein VPG91_11465 [Nitrospirillum amazonense]|uniref:hypothetical protein n=1 Tax=Nitrospirillum amazonense TaxID=28077 RepID=UPI002DD45154|nr:hypothetical protein [Nitrospirillum amazonense]MEC4591607.1 hypothetical protein [Nitrospirillum amazonense]